MRTIAGAAKGAFAAVGGASTTIVKRSATWITSDRCDGTLTEAGPGAVRVRYGGGKIATVRSGQAYLVKGKLFTIAKGRRPPGR